MVYPRYSKTLLVICLLILYCVCKEEAKSINSNIGTITVRPGQNTTQQINGKVGQVIRINPPSNVFTVKTTMLERKNTNGLRMQEALQHFSQFTPSTSCKYNDPDIQVEKTGTQNLNLGLGTIQDSFIDQQNNKAYLRVKSGIQVYIFGDGAFINSGFCDLPTVLRGQGQLRFVKVQNQVGLTNGQLIYKFNIQTRSGQTPRVTLLKWGQLSTNNKAHNIKKAETIRDSLFILGDDYYQMYHYDNSTDKFTLLLDLSNNETLKKQLTHGQFTDFIWEEENPDHLYILTSTGSILEIRNFHMNDSSALIVKNFAGKFQDASAFYKFGDAFEIVFRLSKAGRAYVAEFQHTYVQNPEMDINKERPYILNRFYTRVEEPMDIEYLNGELLILGKQEVHFYGPAVNRNLLQVAGEFPYIGSNEQVSKFHVLESSKNNLKVRMIGISENSIHYYVYQKTKAYITCRLDGDAELIIETLGSCANDTEKTLLLNACKYTDTYDITIKYEFSVLQSMLITVVILLVMIFCCCGVNVSALTESILIRRKVRKLYQKFNLLKQKKQMQRADHTSQHLQSKDAPKEGTEKDLVEA